MENYKRYFSNSEGFFTKNEDLIKFDFCFIFIEVHILLISFLGIQAEVWCKPKIPNRAEIGTATLGANNVFFVVLDNLQHGSAHFSKEDALVEAAQLDFMVNSPELNDGVQGNHDIKILSFMEMMESWVEVVI